MNPELFKNSHTFRYLEAQTARGALKHSYLLITPDRTAASGIFALFAMSLNCAHAAMKNGAPCFECSGCKKVLSGNHSGIAVYNAKFLAADAENVIEDLYIRPIDGERKLYFINGFDAVQPPVQNKLLKSLEEPPSYAVFFLAAANEDAVLKTVASRCEKLYETAFDRDVAAKILRTEFPSDDFVENAVMCAGGFLDAAREMITDAEFRRLFYECAEVMNGVKKSGDIIKYLYRPPFEKERLKTTLNILETLVNATVRGMETNDDRLVFIRGTDVSALNKYVFLIAEARKKNAFNVAAASVAENLLMSMLETKYLCGR
ncbi:MAG: hypothetical protein LBP79_02025 [Clostridiales bacterium]|jgi:DNA polymerase-3 subunit delta'|nr:hypothetical protein [Clostridiales bacterium]